MTRSSATEKMVRVMVYADAEERNADGMKDFAFGLFSEVTQASNQLPSLFILSPDKDVVAYIDYEEVEDTQGEAQKVLQIFEWASGVERQLTRADRMAQRGLYGGAMDEVDEIAEQDAQVSHLIQIMRSRAEEDDEAPEVPVSPMFEGLGESKKAEYEALAQAQLDESRVLFEDEEYRQAQRLLRNLVRGPEDFVTTQPAQALLEEIQEIVRGR